MVSRYQLLSVSDTKIITQTKDILQQSAEKNIFLNVVANTKYNVY
jgi:hypothetical protein